MSRQVPVHISMADMLRQWQRKNDLMLDKSLPIKERKEIMIIMLASYARLEI